MTLRGRILLPYWLVAPAVIVVLAFIIYPVIEVVRLSFTNTSMLTGSAPKYVGFDTYALVLSDPLLPLVLRNTAIWLVLGTVSTVLLGLGIGYFLSFDWRINKLLRAVMLIPWILPGVVIASAWKWMYHGQLGVINDVLLRLGILQERVAWLGVPEIVLYPLIIVITWRLVPLGALIVSAGVQSIPTSLLEAATIDGAGAWSKFRYITLPFLGYILTIITLMSLIAIMNDLVFVWVLTRGGPAHGSEIMATHIYQVAFSSFRFGQSSALSVINFFILMSISLIYLYTLRRSWQGEES